MAVPPADFMLHNSLFLVAHFHNVIIGGVLFGAFAGYTFWFPKAFGFRLEESAGRITSQPDGPKPLLFQAPECLKHYGDGQGCSTFSIQSGSSQSRLQPQLAY
jgi:hypothetical protein